jgi:hypothetical protein
MILIVTPAKAGVHAEHVRAAAEAAWIPAVAGMMGKSR